MHLQYVSDDSGRHTAVLIPIDEWEAITNKYIELKPIEKFSVQKRTMAGFMGPISKETAALLRINSEQTIQEWGRDF